MDEDLPNFFDGVTLPEARKIIAENDHLRSHYGFEIIEYNLIEKLKETSVPQKAI